MNYETPLSGAYEYLCYALNAQPPDSALILWYSHGQSLLDSLDSQLFKCSSAWGNKWPFLEVHFPNAPPRLFNIKCQWASGCDEWAEGLVNQVNRRGGKNDWEDLPNRPFFGCTAHLHETSKGTKYIPPTDEEITRTIAGFAAIERMRNERPPQKLTLDCGLTVDCATIMDYSYLKRMAEIAEEEYHKIAGPPPKSAPPEC